MKQRIFFVILCVVLVVFAAYAAVVESGWTRTSNPGIARTNLATHNAANLTINFIPDARLSANVSLLGQSITEAEIDISNLTDTELLINQAGLVDTIPQTTFVTPAQATNIVQANGGGFFQTNPAAPNSVKTTNDITFDGDLEIDGDLTVTGIGLVTPRVWTDRIDATNLSTLEFTAAGQTLVLGSGGLTLSGAGAGFIGVGANLTGDNEVYGAGWNGDLTFPTKNQVYDKVETLGAGSQTPWLSAINGATFPLTNVGSISQTGATSVTLEQTVKRPVPGASHGYDAMRWHYGGTNDVFWTWELDSATNVFDPNPYSHDHSMTWGYNGNGSAVYNSAEPTMTYSMENNFTTGEGIRQMELYLAVLGGPGYSNHLRPWGWSMIFNDTTHKLSFLHNWNIEQFEMNASNGLAAVQFIMSSTNGVNQTIARDSQLSFLGNTLASGEMIIGRAGQNLVGQYQYGMPVFGSAIAASSNSVLFAPRSLSSGNVTFLAGQTNAYAAFARWNYLSNRWEYSANEGAVALSDLLFRPFNDFSPYQKSYGVSVSLGATAGDYTTLGYWTNSTQNGIAFVEVTAMSVSSGDTLQRWIVPITFADQIASASTWYEVLPEARAGRFTTNHIGVSLDVAGTAGNAAMNFRLRRVDTLSSSTIAVTVNGWSAGSSTDPKRFYFVSGTGTGATVADYYRHTKLTQINGMVGIGTNSPASTLFVVGATTTQGFTNGLTKSGLIYADANGGYTNINLAAGLYYSTATNTLSTSGGSSSGGSTVQTNFVLNTIYTNNSGAVQLYSGLISQTTAGVNGNSGISVLVSTDGGVTFVATGGDSIGTTIAVTLAQTYTNTYAVAVGPTNQVYLTNISTGSGNSALLVAGSGQLTTVGAGTSGTVSGSNGVSYINYPAVKTIEDSVLLGMYTNGFFAFAFSNAPGVGFGIKTDDGVNVLRATPNGIAVLNSPEMDIQVAGNSWLYGSTANRRIRAIDNSEAAEFADSTAPVFGGITLDLDAIAAGNTLVREGNSIVGNTAQVGSHTTPSTSNPLAPTWNDAVHMIWYGATGEIDLPAASGYAKRGVIIYNTGAFTITIDPNGSEVIVRDGTVQTGGVTMTLSSGAGNYVSLICDGVRWVTLGYKGVLAAGS